MGDGAVLDFGAIVHGLRLAVFVFHRTRVLYQNDAASNLRARLQKEYQADLIVMLRDHLHRIRGIDFAVPPPPAVTLLTDARGEPLYVHVLPFGETPQTRHVRGSNMTFIGVAKDRIPGRAIVISALDNLVKGASGQAIQNMNLVMGWPETMGLEQIALFP